MWSPFFFFFLLELSWESALPVLWLCTLLVESLLEVDASFTWGGGGTAAGAAELLVALVAAPFAAVPELI